jgi:hypothetical protein
MIIGILITPIILTVITDNYSFARSDTLVCGFATVNTKFFFSIHRFNTY